MKTASWVITDKQGRAVFETFSERTAQAVNRANYDMWPALQYLQNLNRKIKLEATK